MIDALKPEGILEEQVAFKIIDVGFRLQRIAGIEAGIYNQRFSTTRQMNIKIK